jgi:hypothetical protein
VWNQSVVGINLADKKKQSEIKNNSNLIPFSSIKDISAIAQKFKEDERFNDVIKLSNDFMNREIHVVSLPRETDLERIAETFERINRTGEPLSVFELLTARLYKYNLKTRDMWDNTKERYSFVEFLPPESILKVIALLRGKEPKRRSLLELEPTNFEQDWNRASKVLDEACNRATDLKNGYGVLDFKKWMPYSTMIVPLAAILDFVKHKKLESIGSYQKIDRWYWTSIFSNRYDQAADSNSYSDFNDLKVWVENEGKIPDFLVKFNPSAVDLNTEKQSSAVYRGVINMIVVEGALDFTTGQPPQFDKDKVQDDHIFPKSIYNEHRISNRTLILTNAGKGNKKPSEFFKPILNRHGYDLLNKILKSHLIPEQALTYLLEDNKDKFVELRKKEILGKIQKKCGGD